MPNLLLKNIRPWGGAPVDMAIQDGKISSLSPCLGADSMSGTLRDVERGETLFSNVVDGRGLLALPGFINAHAHIDKSWWGQPWVSYGGDGTTPGRITHERSERDRYGIPSIDSTAFVMKEFLRHGTTATRTHVDVDLGVGLRGIESVRAAAELLDGALDVEIVAFPQDGVIRRPGVLDLLDRAAQEGATNIGGLDPAGIDKDPVAQLDGLFEIAVHRDVGIDIHLHDGNDLGAFQCELIIDRTLATGLQGRVNISHGFALGDIQGSRQAELVQRLSDAAISWTSVAPATGSPLPWHQMREHGLMLGLGTDGIRDLWSPYGDGDMLRIALAFAKLQALRHDDDLSSAVRLATTEAGPFVHRGQHDLLPGSRADVVLLDAENTPDALTRAPRREIVLSAGRVVVSEGELLLP